MNHQESVQERWREEADFANSEYARMLGDTQLNPRMLAKYREPRQMWDWRQRAGRLLGDIRGKALLDYGCGQGEEAGYFAVLGARVTAIDISEVGIRVGRERALANKLDIDFRVMSCIATDFPGESFDVVHGLGILHHVGLAEGLAEVHRVLRPGGVAVFLEPLGSSPLVEAVKRRIHAAVGRPLGLTPVTSGEENLRLADIRRETARWEDRRIYTYRLTHRARKLFLPKLLWDWSLRLDYVLLAAFPPLRHFAGAAVIYLRK
jgi:2-polyprenyl-3-methyl-5-hydroxy-6-metoxy-1,4-benzoquinol methylase